MKTSLAACAAFCLLSSPSLAADETVVVTATRLPESISNLAASVSVVDRATIEARGYLTLADALGDVPGLHLVQSGGPGAQASLFVRGANSNQVLVLRDGVPINDPADPGNSFNFGVDTLSDIERIEIVRGPLSSVYGSGAIGGVINLISRRANQGWHGGGSLSLGLPRALNADAHLSGRSGAWDMTASAGTTSQRGFDITPPRVSSIYTGERDGYRDATGQIEIGYRPAEHTRLFLRLRGRAAKSGYDAYQFDAGNATATDESVLGVAGITSQLWQDNLQTTITASRLQTDRRYQQTEDARDPNQSIEDDFYRGRRSSIEWNNALQLTRLAPALGDRLTFGYAHVNDTSRTGINSLSPFSPYSSTVAAHADTDQISAGWEKQVFGRLGLTAQIRQDWTSLAGSAFTWRLGAVLALPDIAGRLHTAWGTGFRAPGLFDRYGVDSYGFTGNPYLRPERSESGEIGYAQTIDAGNLHATLDVTGFASRTRDLISFAYFPVYTTVNVGNARARGVEAAFNAKLSQYAALSLSYTWLDAQNSDSHTALLRRPRHSGSAALTLTPIPRLRIVPQLRYSGVFSDYLVDAAGNSSLSPGYARDGLIVDLSVAWKLSDQTEIFVDGKNLGDRHFEPASGYQVPGASFLAGVRTGF